MTREEKWKEIDRLLQQAKNDLKIIDKDLTFMEQALYQSTYTSPATKPLLH